VFSHPSKLALIPQAQGAGYLVFVHAVMVPLPLTLVRTRLRAAQGGHSVPEDKVQARYQRLWPQVASALDQADEATVYDNSSARVPFRVVARFQNGRPLGVLDYPSWTPQALLARP
jgi:predicted ABC-type ATPase